MEELVERIIKAIQPACNVKLKRKKSEIIMIMEGEESLVARFTKDKFNKGLIESFVEESVPLKIKNYIKGEVFSYNKKKAPRNQINVDWESGEGRSTFNI